MSQNSNFSASSMNVDDSNSIILSENVLNRLQKRQRLRSIEDDILDKIDDHCSTQIKYVLNKHSVERGLTEGYFDNLIKNIHAKTDKNPVIDGCTNDLITCYKKYPNDTLKCTKEVHAFMSSINKNNLIHQG